MLKLAKQIYLYPFLLKMDFPYPGFKNDVGRFIQSANIVFFLLSVSIAFFFSCDLFPVYAEQTCEAYFYNPESNVDNFAALKSKMDQHLKKVGPFKFQPFIDKELFEKNFKGNRDAIAIISSWHYKILKKENGIKSVLVGFVDGKTTQKKILSAKKNIVVPEMLRGGSIASAGSDDYTRTLLKQMLGQESDGLIASFQLLAVPKDIDALISVGFGLADAALTTDKSLVILSSVNPRLSNELVLLATSEEILLPIVAIPEDHNPGIIKLLLALKDMPGSAGGYKGIQMLGLDGWRKLDEHDGVLLNK